jgi:hypothetical protein
MARERAERRREASERGGGGGGFLEAESEGDVGMSSVMCAIRDVGHDSQTGRSSIEI